jgi:arginyl-tRNA synthetase
VLGVTPAATESWRLGLALAARDTIARALELLGVSAPAQM